MSDAIETDTILAHIEQARAETARAMEAMDDAEDEAAYDCGHALEQVLMLLRTAKRAARDIGQGFPTEEGDYSDE